MQLVDQANAKLAERGYRPDEICVYEHGERDLIVRGSLVPSEVVASEGEMLYLLDFLPRRDEFVEWRALERREEDEAERAPGRVGGR